MTKIVINACHGGFGLSPKAMKEYYRRKGIIIYRYSQTLDELTNHIYHNVPDDTEKCFCDHYATIDKPHLTGTELNNHYIKSSSYDIERDDPHLISIIEELGSDANDQFAELKIVEIPDDVEWEIDEYDGWETIHEKHRSWG